MSRRYRRPAFSVDDTVGSRFALAMERLQCGEPFQFRGIMFCITAGGLVQCTVESSWQAQDVTEETAIRDLDEGESAFQHLMDASSEFRALVGHRPRCFVLIEDYGMGGTVLCTRRNDALEWARGFPRRVE